MQTPTSEQPQNMDISGRRAILVDALNKAIEAFCSHNEKKFGEEMKNVMRPIAEAMGANKIFIDRQIQTDQGNRLMRVYRWRKPGGRLTTENDKLLSDSTASEEWMDTLRQGDCIIRYLPDASGEERALLEKYNLRSIIMVPIFMYGKFWGSVVFQDSEDELRLGEECMDLVQSFARLCANVVARDEMELEIVKQNEINKKMESNIFRLETESEKIYFDPLTGIYNRRFLDERLSRIMNTLSRSGGILSVMMVDIDFFKNYNDTYGHGAGDECLIIIAETLSKSAARADDFVARFGGEEFIVVLPNTEAEGACVIAEKMLENIRNCNMPHSKSSVADIVTVSIGVTTGMVESVHRAYDFILRADEMLYKSKQGGRNIYTFGSL